MGKLLNKSRRWSNRKVGRIFFIKNFKVVWFTSRVCGKRLTEPNLLHTYCQTHTFSDFFSSSQGISVIFPNGMSSWWHYRLFLISRKNRVKLRLLYISRTTSRVQRAALEDLWCQEHPLPLPHTLILNNLSSLGFLLYDVMQMEKGNALSPHPAKAQKEEENPPSTMLRSGAPRTSLNLNTREAFLAPR